MFEYLGPLGSFMPLILMGVLFGFICRSIARAKGKNTGNWFVYGFLFQLIAVIIIASLPSEKVEAEIAESSAKVEGLVERLDKLENEGQRVAPVFKIGDSVIIKKTEKTKNINKKFNLDLDKVYQVVQVEPGQGGPYYYYLNTEQKIKFPGELLESEGEMIFDLPFD